MTKLIDIPDEIIEPLKIMAVKKKMSFASLIVHILKNAAERKRRSFFV